MRKFYACEIYNSFNSYIANYKNKHFLKRFFDSYSDNLAHSKATKAVLNMGELGIKKFPLEKQTYYGLMDSLDTLESMAKKKRIQDNVIDIITI